MASNVDINVSSLRDGKEQALYFRQLTVKHSAKEVCRSLLQAIDIERLGPQIIHIFLSATGSLESVVQCIRQEFSTTVRRAGIKYFGKALIDPNRWSEAWSAIRGTEGLLGLMSNLSVTEVVNLFAVIGSCNRGSKRSKEREVAVEDLLKAMFPSQFPQTRYKSKDKRPIHYHARRLIPACSAKFVLELLENHADSTHPLYQDLRQGSIIMAHPHDARTFAFDNAFQKRSDTVDCNVSGLVGTFTHGVGSDIGGGQGKLSGSMTFSQDLLEVWLKEKREHWPASVSKSSVYLSLYDRCIKKKIRGSGLREIVDLGFRILESEQGSSTGFESALSNGVWPDLVSRWKKQPEEWEDFIVRGVKGGLAGSAKTLCSDYLSFMRSSSAKDERAWPILRMFFLNMPKVSIDIDVTNDFHAVPKQQWDVQVFKKVPNDKAIRLLKGLIRVHLQHYDFLKVTDSGAILNMQRCGPQKNFNALLLLTQLQAASEDQNDKADAEERAGSIVDDLRKKSANSREQTERAMYAKAAHHFAVASGSLQLYAETVTWMQRFVRDPLTVKSVFSQDAIDTSDGAALLSGIDSPIKPGTTLETVSKTVEEANKILLLFHEHRKIAKREPSYQRYDWDAVSALLSSAINARIRRARNLQKDLKAADGEMYSAIWTQTMAMFSKVGPDSLRLVVTPMQELLCSLAPKTLAATTKALLEADNKYREDRSKGEEAEIESRLMEQLTYRSLLALAKGDKPELAEDLLVETIIGRPDASSWHRQMLSMQYLKRLPAKDAETLLLSFATAIGEKLEEQSYVRVGESAGTPSMVKVTTVKYLAQLLDSGEFLSADATVDVLVELFKAGTHPDIRIATVESLLSSLRKQCSNIPKDVIFDGLADVKDPLMRKVIDALQSVVPVAGSINERRPTKEQDWKEAQDDPTRLPEIFPGRHTTLFYALEGAAKTEEFRPLRKIMVDRLLMPILDHSAREHRMWLGIFLKKYKAEIDVGVLPMVPLEPSRIYRMLALSPELIPAHHITWLDELTRLLLAPSTEITALNEHFRRKLEDDTDNPELRHWLGIFDKHVHLAIATNSCKILALLKTCDLPTTNPTGRSITIQQCQTAILSHVDMLLAQYDEHIGTWDALVKGLRYYHNDTHANQPRWIAQVRPVLEDIIRLVEGKRTLEWTKNPHRKPALLPSTTPLKMHLMLGQARRTDDKDKGFSFNDCGRLTEEVIALVHEQLEGQQGVSPSRAAKLIKELELPHTEFREPERLTIGTLLGIRGAVLVGRMKSSEKMVASVMIGAADSLLASAASNVEKAASEEVKELMREMFTRWQGSESEELRERALDWRTGQKKVWTVVFEKNKEVKK